MSVVANRSSPSSDVDCDEDSALMRAASPSVDRRSFSSLSPPLLRRVLLCMQPAEVCLAASISSAVASSARGDDLWAAILVLVLDSLDVPAEVKLLLRQAISQRPDILRCHPQLAPPQRKLSRIEDEAPSESVSGGGGGNGGTHSPRPIYPTLTPVLSSLAATGIPRARSTVALNIATSLTSGGGLGGGLSSGVTPVGTPGPFLLPPPSGLIRSNSSPRIGDCGSDNGESILSSSHREHPIVSPRERGAGAGNGGDEEKDKALSSAAGLAVSSASSLGGVGGGSASSSPSAGMSLLSVRWLSSPHSLKQLYAQSLQAGYKRWGPVVSALMRSGVGVPRSVRISVALLVLVAIIAASVQLFSTPEGWTARTLSLVLSSCAACIAFVLGWNARRVLVGVLRARSLLRRGGRSELVRSDLAWWASRRATAFWDARYRVWSPPRHGGSVLPLATFVAAGGGSFVLLWGLITLFVSPWPTAGALFAMLIPLASTTLAFQVARVAVLGRACHLLGLVTLTLLQMGFLAFLTVSVRHGVALAVLHRGFLGVLGLGLSFVPNALLLFALLWTHEDYLAGWSGAESGGGMDRHGGPFGWSASDEDRLEHNGGADPDEPHLGGLFFGLVFEESLRGLFPPRAWRLCLQGAPLAVLSGLAGAIGSTMYWPLLFQSAFDGGLGPLAMGGGERVFHVISALCAVGSTALAGVFATLVGLQNCRVQHARGRGEWWWTSLLAAAACWSAAWLSWCWWRAGLIDRGVTAAQIDAHWVSSWITWAAALCALACSALLATLATLIWLYRPNDRAHEESLDGQLTPTGEPSSSSLLHPVTPPRLHPDAFRLTPLPSLAPLRQLSFLESLQVPASPAVLDDEEFAEQLRHIQAAATNDRRGRAASFE